MKIVMISDFYGVGQQYQENLIAKYYKLLGHDVHIITSTFIHVFDYLNDHFDKTVPAFMEHDGYATIHRLPYKWKYKNLFRVFDSIGPIIEETKPDLIYFHNVSLNIHQAVPYLKANPQARMIMDIHIDYSNVGQTWKSVHVLHGFIRKNYLKRYLPYFSCIFPVVPNGIKFMHEVYGVPLEKMQLLPLGYDEEMAEEIRASVDRCDIRNQLGIQDDDFLIITGGKFTKEKRTELLLEAVDLLQCKDIHIAVFGAPTSEQDEYANKLRSMANERVHFLGWLNGEQMLRYMHAADLAVYPSSQSVLWQQSIGMHLPLIVGDSGQQDPSYLNRHNNMVILNRDDINALMLSYNIEYIFCNTVLYAAMRAGAEKTAAEYLGYSRICETTLREAFKS